MLANTLNTNEIKDSAGVEQEFSRLSQNERQTEFAFIGETPAYPHRLSIKHTELGNGVNKRRRSMVRFDKVVAGQVDSETPSNIAFYVVADIPIGNLTSYAEPANVAANLMSFLATTGAATTVLFDGSGNGASAILNGSL